MCPIYLDYPDHNYCAYFATGATRKKNVSRAVYFYVINLENFHSLITSAAVESILTYKRAQRTSYECLDQPVPAERTHKHYTTVLLIFQSN